MLRFSLFFEFIKYLSKRLVTDSSLKFVNIATNRLSIQYIVWLKLSV